MHFSILTANRFGIPNLVMCSVCDEVLERPHGDRYGHLLALIAREHELAHAERRPTSQ